MPCECCLCRWLFVLAALVAARLAVACPLIPAATFAITARANASATSHQHTAPGRPHTV
ncbi:hypothetical protein [Winogradskya humida]|uniref:hypothetical protein n=1 Tax=Winogradskya humida TaxID=113566 RepID=UPI001941D593|nr:hypothetical protein [Actinoplanes humidus]